MGFIKVTKDSESQCETSNIRDDYKVHEVELVRPSEPEDPNKKHFARIRIV